jgi:hypothetical protein
VLHLWMLRGGCFDDLRLTEGLVKAGLVAAPSLTVNHRAIYSELSGDVQQRGLCGLGYMGVRGYGVL